MHAHHETKNQQVTLDGQSREQLALKLMQFYNRFPFLVVILLQLVYGGWGEGAELSMGGLRLAVTVWNSWP